jgi:pimeloyl-ACP methyl ester carboxylesterase
MNKLFKYLLITFAALITLFIAAILLLYQSDIPVENLKATYANEASKFMDLMGMQVHYRDEGNASDSIPLVLIHGTGAFLQTWDACTAEWTKDYRVIRMDMPAFGLTGPAPDNDYSIEAYVDFLHHFLQNRKVNRCYLAGNSLGGLIAYSYAAAYPGEVQKLILVDAAGYPIENAKGSLAFTLGRIPVVKQLLKIVTPASVVRKSLEDVYGNKARVTDALVKQYRDMACREGNRNALLIRLNNPLSGDTTIVPEIKVPTMIIWGDLDFLIPLDNAYKFQRDLPNDTLVVLKGIGHVPMEESPEQVIPLVKNFIGNGR